MAMGDNPSHFEGPKNPVEMVSWTDCQKFLDKLNEKFGPGRGKFQLPTEAQWEYACRAGSTMRRGYGYDEAGLGQYAWYGENSGGQTHPVGEKQPNAWGLYDMYGNVFEWCQDWYDDSYYAKSPTDDPTGPAQGHRRACRGSAWNDHAWRCGPAERGGSKPGDRSFGLGVRACLVPADR